MPIPKPSDSEKTEKPFSKFIYEQFGEDLEDETKKYKAVGESKKVKFVKCNHKNIKFITDDTGTRLQCSCGVAYKGPRLEELYKALTKS